MPAQPGETIMGLVIDIAGVLLLVEVGAVVVVFGGSALAMLGSKLACRWRAWRAPPAPEYLEVECWGGIYDGKIVRLYEGQYHYEVHQPVLVDGNGWVTLHDEDEFVVLGDTPEFGTIVHRYQLVITMDQGLRLEHVE
jgi:hypothetical protein